MSDIKDNPAELRRMRLQRLPYVAVLGMLTIGLTAVFVLIAVGIIVP